MQAVWRRKAHVLRHSGKIERAVEELSAMLDTFYTEIDGWLELADIYATCHQHTYALQALSHALLLSPQNPAYFLQYAETAYLAEDVPLALKMFLQTVDMTDDDDGDLAPSDSIPIGITLRAWFGVKLVRVAHSSVWRTWPHGRCSSARGNSLQSHAPPPILLLKPPLPIPPMCPSLMTCRRRGYELRTSI